MGLFDSLPTLGEIQGLRRAVPKYAEKSRLQAKREKTTDHRKTWDAVTREIWMRDHGRDRLTRRKVKKTIALDPLRGEVHHVVSRDDRAVRYDRRNLLLLSLETHGRVERHELRIVGTHWFTINGKTYVNTEYPVRFEKVG